MEEKKRIVENHFWKLYKEQDKDLINDELIINYITKETSHSIDHLFIKNHIYNIKKYKDQLNKLRELPQVKQRTDIWYELRRERLTASDTYYAISNCRQREQLVKKKAFPPTDTFNSMAIPALRHGVIFEPMAQRCYKQRNNDIPIYEFGLLIDDSLPYGASPDGINELGIMIEIKCPKSRVINGSISDVYRLQMQGQMAVCKLKECDFIECDIKEYITIEEYRDDPKIEDTSKVDHGIILEYKDRFEISPEYLTKTEVIDWFFTIVKDNSECNIIPWRLNYILVQRIEFDEKLWQKCSPEIIKFWSDVIECRKNPNIYDKDNDKNKKERRDKKPKYKIEFDDDD